MKKGFKLGLYGLLLLFTVVLFVEKASFAGSKMEIVYQNSDGSIGLARMRISGFSKVNAKAKAEARANGEFNAAPNPKVQLYSAFTSDKVPAEHSSEDITYFAWLDKNQAYLIGAFTVTGGSSLVKVHWLVDNDEKAVTVFDDPEEPDGTQLSTSYWYFAWYKGVSGDFTGSSKLHDLRVKVGIWDGSTETNTVHTDCKFKVVNQ